MIKTLGLTHIALPVKDVKRTSAFYHELFGSKEMYTSDDFVQLQTPGSKDILVFENQKRSSKGMKDHFHFGFRSQKPFKIEAIVEKVRRAGGKVKASGEFVPGSPYVFFYDPDGYEVEIWYEKIPRHLKTFN
jgi:catechol 2,3-dioxygenase-like lactoylglutathione lyase family enzyme